MINIKFKKPNFSKLLCVISVAIFIWTLYTAFDFVRKGFPTDVFVYAIPAEAVFVGATFGFNYNKSKAENLSKQRIRYVLMKLLLQGKIPGDLYTEICEEIDNIDSILDTKLNGSLQEAVSEDITVET